MLLKNWNQETVFLVNPWTTNVPLVKKPVNWFTELIRGLYERNIGCWRVNWNYFENKTIFQHWWRPMSLFFWDFLGKLDMGFFWMSTELLKDWNSGTPSLKTILDWFRALKFTIIYVIFLIFCKYIILNAYSHPHFVLKLSSLSEKFQSQCSYKIMLVLCKGFKISSVNGRS